MYETQHLSLWCGGVGAAEPRWRGPGLGSLGGAARETEEVTARSHVHGLELASLGPGHAGRYSCGRTRLQLAVHGTDLTLQSAAPRCVSMCRDLGPRHDAVGLHQPQPGGGPGRGAGAGVRGGGQVSSDWWIGCHVTGCSLPIGQPRPRHGVAAGPGAPGGGGGEAEAGARQPRHQEHCALC